MESPLLLTTKQVAEILGVSSATVNKYVQEKKLTPYKSDPYQIDKTKFFLEATVLEFKEKNKKPGLTTGEACKELGIHRETLKALIKEGRIKATKHFYKGKDMYFVSAEEIQSYREKQGKSGKGYFIKNGNLGLFQLYKHGMINEYGRLFSLAVNRTGYLKTTMGRKIDISSKEFDEFLPIYNMEELHFITRKGYARLHFQLSDDVESPIYSLIDVFYKYAGTNNIKLFTEAENITIHLKPVLLNINSQYNMELVKLL
jgi:excisionase family DNA binding protein